MMDSGLGDAARPRLLTRQSTALKTDLARLSQELASGRRADPAKAAGGDLGGLAAVARTLALAQTYRANAATLATQAAAQQSALETVADILDTAAADVDAVRAGRGSPPSPANALGRLSDAVAAIGTRVAGTAVFGGTRPDAPPVAGAEEIVAQITPLLSAPDPAAAIADWFLSPGGGFETQAYAGGGRASRVPVADGLDLGLEATALDLGLRRGLMGLAIEAVVAAGGWPGEPEAGRAAAADALRQAGGEIIDLRAEVGTLEARIAEAEAQTARRTAEAETTRTALAGADPYRTAVELQATEGALDALFTITARLSRLTLTEYLR